ncbi:hypothetical protein K438DRAFT_1761110 [Mycena galopus ATCC 62051]|nr:hypothetical protein K438DRAFT_1761110 [Mycena galopus ATCC 62051]
MFNHMPLLATTLVTLFSGALAAPPKPRDDADIAVDLCIQNPLIECATVLVEPVTCTNLSGSLAYLNKSIALVSIGAGTNCSFWALRLRLDRAWQRGGSDRGPVAYVQLCLVTAVRMAYGGYRDLFGQCGHTARACCRRTHKRPPATTSGSGTTTQDGFFRRVRGGTYVVKAMTGSERGRTFGRYDVSRRSSKEEIYRKADENEAFPGESGINIPLYPRGNWEHVFDFWCAFKGLQIIKIFLRRLQG